MQIRRPPPKGRYADRGRVLRRAAMGALPSQAGAPPACRGEAGRIERFGVGPPAGVVVDVVDRDDHRGAGTDVVPVDDVVLDRLPGDDPHRREVALRLLDARRGPLQSPQLSGGGPTTGEHIVDFGQHPGSCIGVACHQVPEPGHRVGGGLVPGQHERQRLIAHPLTWPRPVVRREQYVEQIGGLDGVPAGPRARPRTCTTTARRRQAVASGPRSRAAPASRVRRSPLVARSFMLCTSGPKSWLNSAFATTRSVASTIVACMSNSIRSPRAARPAVTCSIGSIIRSTISLR